MKPKRRRRRRVREWIEGIKVEQPASDAAPIATTPAVTKVPTRLPTKPLPMEIWKPFVDCMKSLARHGHFSHGGCEFGVNRGNLTSRRAGLMILTQFEVAGRWNEVSAFRRQDLVGQEIAVRRSKSSKGRRMPITPELAKLVPLWRRQFDIYPEAKECDLLFPTTNGKPVDLDSFNRSTLRPIGQVFDVALTTHVMRDTACIIRAVDCPAGLNPVMACQDLLGHKSPNSTANYMNKMGELNLRSPLSRFE